MLPSIIVINFIKSLTSDSAYAYCQKFAINLKKTEIKLVLPYLKQNIADIVNSPSPSKKIHADLDYKIDMNIVSQLCLLVNKLGYN